ncbi:interleukin-12 subunit alpha isoform X2 [Acanthopagrus latus]|uniref:interleukin-12 subunit alpha isoform X2 n=1 Tax=Acanthopagrus latus TaxID=8177 RepID=UPI00187C9486|nr:interleukin-12 subunit alpha isoform X2 [Acanthopagrus latus]
MTICNLYFSSCVLLLLTSSWRAASGLPLRTLSPERCEQCSSLFRSLLLNISGLPDNEGLCYGITSSKAVVKSSAETVLACAPTQSSGCMMQRNSSFSESECMRNIMKDLAHYDAVIQSYLRITPVPLLNPTLGIIQDLRKTCSPMADGDSDSSEDVAQMWGNDSFINRQEMCKMMRGFYARLITINRAMGYISSGDHRM